LFWSFSVAKNLGGEELEQGKGGREELERRRYFCYNSILSLSNSMPFKPSILELGRPTVSLHGLPIEFSSLVVSPTEETTMPPVGDASSPQAIEEGNRVLTTLKSSQVAISAGTQSTSPRPEKWQCYPSSTNVCPARL
jgi:hypothetical protein